MKKPSLSHVLSASAITIASAVLCGAAYAAPDLDKAQVKARLLANHVSTKITAADLEALLQKAVDKVIVVYKDAPIAGDEVGNEIDAKGKLRIKQHRFAAQKIAVDKSVPGLTVVKDLTSLPIRYIRIKNQNELLKLIENPLVESVSLSRQGDPQLAESLGLISFPELALRSPRFDANGTTVAILDTGLDYTKAIFGSCIAPGVPANCRVTLSEDTALEDGLIDDPANGSAGSGSGVGHGTAIAGIIASMAPGAKLMAFDVRERKECHPEDSPGNMCNSVPEIAVFAAINRLLELKAQHNIVAANMSISFHKDYFNQGDGGFFNTQCTQFPAWTAAFKNLRDAGIAPVVASGNNSKANALSVPACVPGAVTVGAVYDESRPDIAPKENCPSPVENSIACYSNGGSVHLLAPGSYIHVPGVTSAPINGTSFAAPHVAAAFAIMRAPGSGGEFDSIFDTLIRLRSTAWPIIDARTGKKYHGMDIGAAVKSLLGGHPPGWSPAD